MANPKFIKIIYEAATDATPTNPYVWTQETTTPNAANLIEVKMTSLSKLRAASRFFTFSATPVEPLSGMIYVNLSIPQPFAIALSNTLTFAQFSCTDGSAHWDDADLPRLQGTASEAIAAGLVSKCVLIGDRDQEFEMFGERSPGPFVFRSCYSAVQIISVGDVFRVCPVMLQPLEISLNTGGNTGQGSVLPADNSKYQLFLLSGHATLPDGLYRYDSAGIWVQV
jgi:hypothetical protein